MKERNLSNATFVILAFHKRVTLTNMFMFMKEEN